MVERDYNLDSTALDGLANLLRQNALNNSIYDDEELIENTFLDYDKLYELYKNNIISRIVNIYPDNAFDNGYHVLNSQGEIIDSNNIFILTAFKEASIKARMLGKSFLVFNPDDGSPINSNLVLNSYKIYDKLHDTGKDFWVNTNHMEIEYYGKDKLQKRKNFVVKKYPKANVFLFFGKKTYKENVLPDEDSYSCSIIEGFYKQLYNYMNASAYGRKILQNLSNLSLGISQLSIQLRDRATAQKIYQRAALLDENRNLNSVILHDKDSEELSYISQHLDNVTSFIGHLEHLVAASTDGIPKERIFNYDEGSGYYTHLIIRQMWAENVSKWSRVNWLTHLINIYQQINVQFDKIVIPLPIVLTQLEQSELELNGASRLEKLIRNGVINPNEGRSGYKNELYTLNIELNDSTVDNELSDISQTPNNLTLDSYSNKTLHKLSKVNINDYYELYDDLTNFLNGI